MLFIDTEGSFIVERAAEIAAAAVQHISNVVDEKEDPGNYNSRTKTAQYNLAVMDSLITHCVISHRDSAMC